MKNLFVVLLILAYILATAFLETEEGSRVTTSDLMLVGLIMMSFLATLASSRFAISPIHLFALPMLAIFLVGSFQAFYVDRAAFELLIIVFSFVGSIAIANLLVGLPDIWLSRFLRGYVLVIGGLSLVCLIDFLLLPGLISSRQLGGLQGPFRNTGQAGSFFGVHFALVVALMVGRLVPRSPVDISAVILVAFALLFTFKRASILAAVVGVALFLLFLLFSRSLKDKKIAALLLLGGTVVGLLGLFVFNWAIGEVAGMQWRFEHKFSADTWENFSEGFVAQNIRSAFAALADSPFLGVGLDNVREVYQHHEIHSTYLGVLAYGGLLGTIAYAVFMIALLSSVFVESRFRTKNSWAAFLYVLLPLLLGLLIGWAYTYHIRKREFWILVTFIVIAVHMSRSLRTTPKRCEEGTKGNLPLPHSGARA
jgi:hypothetical protein